MVQDLLIKALERNMVLKGVWEGGGRFLGKKNKKRGEAKTLEKNFLEGGEIKRNERK
jgi:hypothetical protein